MAVVIEAMCVIVRKATLEAKYPGGVRAFAEGCPNATLCADDHLVRIAFMVQNDAKSFAAELAGKGLTLREHGNAADVALVSSTHGYHLPCDWLELGLWDQTTIAWLKGADPGDIVSDDQWNASRSLQWMSSAEAKERLEFVRRDGAVDVYRDKQTGGEVYVGRTHGADDEERHDALYQEAADLVKGQILVHGVDAPSLDATSHAKLEKAIGLFEEVVRIRPTNWAAMWLLGKTYQRLKNYELGLEWFSRAHRVHPEQPDVAREASIAAMDLGRPEAAIAFCERAIEANPDDPGLRANLALSMLFAQRPQDAVAVARDALQRDPSDAITGNIVRIAEEVVAGQRPCPRHVRDLR